MQLKKYLRDTIIKRCCHEDSTLVSHTRFEQYVLQLYDDTAIDYNLYKSLCYDQYRILEAELTKATSISAQLELLLGDLLKGNVQFNGGSSIPLIKFAHRGDTAKVRKCLGNTTTDVDQTESDGYTALAIASNRGYAKIVKMLINAKANVKKATKEGFAPLFLATKNNHVHIAEMLIRAGADLEQALTTGFTPLLFAIFDGNKGIAEMLIRAGVDVNKVATGTAMASWTALIAAADNDQKEIAEMLIRAGAKVDVPTKEGTTPLLLAAQKGHAAIAKILLCNKANPHYRDNSGKNAITVAIFNRNVEMVSLLVQFGANDRIALELAVKLRTRLNLAKEQSDELDKIIKILEQAQKSIPTTSAAAQSTIAQSTGAAPSATATIAATRPSPK